MTLSEKLEAVATASQLGMALAIGAGVWIAYTQLSAWRGERQAVRRSQVAEEFIVAALNVEDAFKDIRSQLTKIPRDKANDKIHGYQMRMDKISSHHEVFGDLRNSQIRARATFGNTDVEEAANELFSARAEVASSIEILADYARNEDEHPDDREHKKSLRSSMSGGFGANDELGTKIIEAVKRIEDGLADAARLKKIEK